MSLEISLHSAQQFSLLSTNRAIEVMPADMKYSVFLKQLTQPISRMTKILRCFQTRFFFLRFFRVMETFQIQKSTGIRSLRNNKPHVFSREGVNLTSCQHLRLLSALLNDSQIGMICETRGLVRVSEGSLGVGNRVVNDLVSKGVECLEKRSLVSAVNHHKNTHDSSKFTIVMRTSRMICSGVLPSRTRGASRLNP